MDMSTLFKLHSTDIQETNFLQDADLQHLVISAV